MDNAIRYTPVGGCIVFTMQHDLNSENVIIIVENSGENLNEDVIAQLGQRFYRVLGTKTQGSGLGLSIAKKIMNLHGGALIFSVSALGGLTVVLKFD